MTATAPVLEEARRGRWWAPLLAVSQLTQLLRFQRWECTVNSFNQADEPPPQPPHASLRPQSAREAPPAPDADAVLAATLHPSGQRTSAALAARGSCGPTDAFQPDERALDGGDGSQQERGIIRALRGRLKEETARADKLLATLESFSPDELESLAELGELRSSCARLYDENVRLDRTVALLTPGVHSEDQPWSPRLASVGDATVVHRGVVAAAMPQPKHSASRPSTAASAARPATAIAAGGVAVGATTRPTTSSAVIRPAGASPGEMLSAVASGWDHELAPAASAPAGAPAGERAGGRSTWDERKQAFEAERARAHEATMMSYASVRYTGAPYAEMISLYDDGSRRRPVNAASSPTSPHSRSPRAPVTGGHSPGRLVGQSPAAAAAAAAAAASAAAATAAAASPNPSPAAGRPGGAPLGRVAALPRNSGAGTVMMIGTPKAGGPASPVRSGRVGRKQQSAGLRPSESLPQL